jgi:CheY-like chemotaxis protein
LQVALAPGKPVERTRRILFVDDEPQVLEGLQSALRRDLEGWHSAWRTSAAAALAEFRAAPFDVVVTDVRMPGMDGIELLSKIKGMVRSVRGIVLTGYAAPAAMPIADVVLRKPCPISVLRQAALAA